MPGRLFLPCTVLIFLATSLPLKAYPQSTDKESQSFVNDISRLNPIPVYKITKVKSTEDARSALLFAKNNKLKVSIMGKRHSQGGHIAFENALVLDMTEFNKVLSFDLENKIIVVQSGITWAGIQEYINNYGLAIKVMQSSNIFTVGGSLGSNIHGRDPRFGTIIETVQSFRLLTPDTNILNVSREENSELFNLVIGGYGLFGVVLDVALELTDNEVYTKTVDRFSYQDYPVFLEKQILSDEKVRLHFARISFAPSSLLKDIYSTTYRITDETSKNVLVLNKEKNIIRNKIIFDISRRFTWGKELRWYLQNKYADLPEEHLSSRNNAMRPPIEFLDYESRSKTDFLQEYFIPPSQFAVFIDEFRNLIQEYKINLLSATLRYVPKSEDGFLSYSKSDAIGIVLYINQGLSEKDRGKAEVWTRALIDLALKCQGTYYLTYQLYAAPEQFKRAYPKAKIFFEKKRKYDPEELFLNKFYKKYASPQEN